MLHLEALPVKSPAHLFSICTLGHLRLKNHPMLAYIRLGKILMQGVNYKNLLPYIAFPIFQLLIVWFRSHGQDKAMERLQKIKQNELGESSTQTRPSIKRKRAKGPNPLSCKKKKKKVTNSKDGALVTCSNQTADGAKKRGSVLRFRNI